MLNLYEISKHEEANMRIRHAYGYGNHDAHIWTWLLYQLKLYGDNHPFKVGGNQWLTSTNSK